MPKFFSDAWLLTAEGLRKDAGPVQRPWLGDALDFWKGEFLRILRASDASSRPIKILPMFTDAHWTAAEIDTYASILGVPKTAILSTAKLRKSKRTN